MRGIIFNIQRFSLFDGPGIRTVVFMKGCPLHCTWCHNPEGISPEPEIMYEPTMCIGCGECAGACAKGMHIFQGGMHGYMRKGCTACGSCAESCCSGALSLSGYYTDTEQVLDEVMKDAPVFAESGGGITLSGGEPFYQADFTTELAASAKARGISVCIETSGMADPRKLSEAAAYTDFFYYDYKVTGEEEHKRLCGASQKTILDNLSVLDDNGSRVTLTCPIVPGLNDCKEHMRAISHIARMHSCIRDIQLKPYHRLGLSKAKKLGTEPGYDTEPPEVETLEAFRDSIRSCSGKPCEIP